ncbi:MAG: hypothetical protein AB7F99_00220 [Vicinamibacterales bacterium]
MRLTCLATALSLLIATSASAQDSVSDVLAFLVTNQAVPTDDFVKDREAASATLDTISRFLQIELGSLPVGSSAAGYVYRLNPALGTVERASENFGPFFLQRALTSGARQVSIGLSFRHTAFETLDGRELRDGTLVTTANRLSNETQPFDVEALTLRLDADTVTFSATYGIADRLDVGAAIPVVHLALSGERRNVYRGSVLQQAVGSASATGLGDIAMRAKYSLGTVGSLRLAADVDLRLPTGSSNQLLGAGKAGVVVSAIGSIESRWVGSHFTFGVGQGGASDAFNFGGAVAVSPTPRLTMVGEVSGRRLQDLAAVVDATAPHPTVPNVETTRLLSGATGRNTAVALAGVKWNAIGTWLLGANVLLPMTDSGLTPGPTLTLALDYTFEM